MKQQRKTILPIVFPGLSRKDRMEIVGKPHIISEMEILRAITKVYGLDVNELLHRDSRKRGKVEPRQMFMHFMRTYTGLHYKQIGELFHPRFDHSTIIHGINTIKNDYETNEQIRQRYHLIEKLILE